jgi:hypothetical protein
LLPAPITCLPAHPMLSPNMPAPQHSAPTHLEDLDQLQLAAALQLKALRSAGRKAYASVQRGVTASRSVNPGQ